jgi:recombinational DNA repair protein (RecF pathway)
MYQKYHTEALVLQALESGESDKAFALFTRDFGLVRSRASAVRSEYSKMRYALQSFSRAHISLIKGKRGWRLAGAAAIKNAGSDREALAVFARIAALTLRLVHGEETNEYLFAALADAHKTLMSGQREIPLATIEIVCVARILYALGYLSTEALEGTLFTHTAYSVEHILEAEEMKDKLLSSINKAIAETQL